IEVQSEKGVFHGRVRIVYFALREAQVDGPFREQGRPAPMTLPVKTLTLLVYISLGVNALLLLAVVTLAARRRHPTQAQPVAMDEILRGVVDGQARSLQRLEQAM